MIKVINMNENIVTDLRNNGIIISKTVIKNISFDIDIQTANVEKLNITKWQDAKGKYILISNNATNEIIAIYDKDKFTYNPERLKVSELTDTTLYTCWEVINKSSIMQKHNDRLALKQDYVDLQKDNTTYNKPPTSTRYVLDKDWNADRNREYYTKLLQQNKLGQYSDYLDYVYTVMEDLIKHRRAEKTVGKKAVYTDYIKRLSNQISTTELLMDALDKNMNPDIDKLKKSITTLSNSAKLAAKFINTEDDAIKVWGYTPKRKSVKIER